MVAYLGAKQAARLDFLRDIQTFIPPVVVCFMICAVALKQLVVTFLSNILVHFVGKGGM